MTIQWNDSPHGHKKEIEKNQDNNSGGGLSTELEIRGSQFSEKG